MAFFHYSSQGLLEGVHIYPYLSIVQQFSVLSLCGFSPAVIPLSGRYIGMPCKLLDGAYVCTGIQQLSYESTEYIVQESSLPGLLSTSLQRVECS